MSEGERPEQYYAGSAPSAAQDQSPVLPGLVVPRDRGIRILSIDAIMPGPSLLDALQQVMREISPRKPCDFFDIIGGISAGGVLAVMLGRLQMSTFDCRRTLQEVAGRPLFTWDDFPNINVRTLLSRSGIDMEATFATTEHTSQCRTIIHAFTDSKQELVSYADWQREKKSYSPPSKDHLPWFQTRDDDRCIREAAVLTLKAERVMFPQHFSWNDLFPVRSWRDKINQRYRPSVNVPYTFRNEYNSVERICAEVLDALPGAVEQDRQPLVVMSLGDLERDRRVAQAIEHRLNSPLSGVLYHRLLVNSKEEQRRAIIQRWAQSLEAR
ncbi:hypothetical protein KVT40_002499 [Elsinoe batatas]|uniref:PNPLA domain-containing protein n=1 Tax=Elsinoe batatas TaxID=2601811 RepID=A0A8K0PKA5_9PEZI|nr:hypothetical protein KVT40_002499 [Elsinoe batatas]